MVDLCNDRRGTGGGRVDEEAKFSGVGEEREEYVPEGARDLKHEAGSKIHAVFDCQIRAYLANPALSGVLGEGCHMKEIIEQIYNSGYNIWLLTDLKLSMPMPFKSIPRPESLSSSVNSAALSQYGIGDLAGILPVR